MGRLLQRCLGALRAINGHRGNQLSRLGCAFAAALEPQSVSQGVPTASTRSTPASTSPRRTVQQVVLGPPRGPPGQFHFRAEAASPALQRRHVQQQHQQLPVGGSQVVGSAAAAAESVAQGILRMDASLSVPAQTAAAIASVPAMLASAMAPSSRKSQPPPRAAPSLAVGGRGSCGVQTLDSFIVGAGDQLYNDALGGVLNEPHGDTALN